MKVLDWFKTARALGAGGLVGAVGRVVAAAEGADEGLKRPEFAELRGALDELRRALRKR